MSKIKLIDGSVFVPKELFDKSEVLKAPGGNTQPLNVRTFSALIMASNDIPLPNDIPKNLLYKYWPHLKPPDIPTPEEVKKKAEEVKRKMKQLSKYLKKKDPQRISCFMLPFYSHDKIKQMNKEYIEIIRKFDSVIPVGANSAGVLAIIKDLNKVNKVQLEDHDEKYQLIDKLYNLFLNNRSNLKEQSKEENSKKAK